MKQATDETAHEQKRNENRDERETNRNDGETNLTRAFQRGLKRWLALLNEAHDVFDYDNRIIDNESGRNRQRHEREVIEAVTAQPHHAEGARERERNRNTGDERRPEPAQEEKHHHHDERHRNDERQLYVPH